MVLGFVPVFCKMIPSVFCKFLTRGRKETGFKEMEQFYK